MFGICLWSYKQAAGTELKFQVMRLDCFLLVVDGFVLILTCRKKLVLVPGYAVLEVGIWSRN